MRRTGYAFRQRGWWHARVTFRTSGHRHQWIRKAPENTRVAALALCRALIAELAAREVNPSAPRTLYALLARFEAAHVHPPTYRDGHKTSGYHSEKSLRSHLTALRRLLPDQPLSEFRSADVDRLKAALLTDPVRHFSGRKVVVTKKARSLASVHRSLEVLRHVFSGSDDAPLERAPRNPSLADGHG